MTTFERSKESLLRRGAALLALTFALTGCGPVDDDGGSPSDDDNGEVTTNGEIDEIRSSAQRVTKPQVPQSDLDQLTSDNADFAFDLYGNLAEEQSGKNFFYSPHSISTALAMTYAGLEGSSETQTKQALHFGLAEKDLHPAFNKLDLELKKRASQAGDEEEGSPFKLKVANAIWGQKNYSFEQPFLKTLAKNYGAGMRAVDFQTKAEKARNAINDWVEKKTENKIKDLLPKGSVNSLTRLVLTNAIYFKASWEHKFDKNSTKKASFTTGAGKNVQVDMMSLRQRNGLSYTSDTDYQAVELPYVGNKVSMVVLVPNKGAFDKVEGKLSGSFIRKVFKNLSGQAMDLKMPKFDFKTKFSVKKMLQALGMKHPFDVSNADLTGITKTEKLFVNDVIHQSFVAVDENGTEAAAATAVTAGATSVPKYVNLTVDRPFIFLIRDKPTNAVLFAGRVLEP